MVRHGTPEPGAVEVTGFDRDRAAQYFIPIMYTVTSRERTFTLVGIMVALFLGALDQTIVATAMPRILQELNGLSPLHLGGHRLPAGLHVHDPHLWKDFGPVRPQGRRPGRRAPFPRRLRALGAVTVHDGADHLPRRAGTGQRGHLLHGIHRGCRHLHPGGARQVPGALRRRLRHRQRPGPVAGRTSHGQPFLAMGILRERSHRPGRADASSSSRCRP